ncbi:MAG: hypothetical protein V7637_1390 [Mycobacteriales bacterium]
MTRAAAPEPALDPAPPSDPDLAYLWHRLGLLEARVRWSVTARRATDPAPDDPYRGTYLTLEDVQRILAARREHWDSTPPHGAAPRPAGLAEVGRPPRLLDLAGCFGLTGLDVELLLVALAPDIDPRFERLYGYLNDDVTRRRATIGLALELCGEPVAGAGRARFAATAPLVAGGVLEVREPELPALSRPLRVTDRVVGHLLGDDRPDARLAGLVTLIEPAEPGERGERGEPAGPGGPGGAGPAGRVRPAGPAAEPVAGLVAGSVAGSVEPAAGAAGRIRAALDAGIAVLHLRETAGGARHAAVDALLGTGRGALLPDPAGLAELADPDAVLTALVREARLRGAGIVLGPLETLDPGSAGRARPLRELTRRAAGVPLLIYGGRPWDPQWTPQPPVTIAVPPPDADRLARLWHALLADAIGGPSAAAAMTGYRLSAEQVRGAASIAAQLARIDRRPVGPDDLRAGVRAWNGAGLERLARRITPAVGWDDLVLPELTRQQLREVVIRARHRDRVLGRWRMRPGGGRGRGVVALFAGESGTGKTMSAEVVAAELGLDLYVVDLSAVVDKYVGETEKNLERVFTEAAGVNGVLLFDEADAVFGRRSEVRDAHDRYANVESAYLLQRVESFDGIAVLTTNLRSNVDPAFTRRLDVVVDFPQPDAAERLALWDRCLGPDLPRAGDLDLAFCAERFELTGGSIRACAVSAAYLAADADRPVGMAEVIAAVHQEYRKLGRLLLDSEFGPWLASPA